MGGRQCPTEYSPQCPSVEGETAACEVKANCPAEGCQENGQICCPIACGGCTCLHVMEKARRAVHVPYLCPVFILAFGACEGYALTNETCQTLNCNEKGKICCGGPCGDPFCV
uniref:Uncharacterized protein n=1 Tax=Amblyomma maculatum TaxID=34609 RepID=G3MTH0_AMBMU